MRNIARLAAAFVAAVAVNGAAVAAPQENFGGLWYNPSESGWGVAVDQQGDTMFAVLLTYDPAGQPVWFEVPSMARADNPFVEGDIHAGPMYLARSNSPSGDGTIFSSDVSVALVGNAQLNFGAESASTFSYGIDGILASKAIAPFVFADAPSACNFQGLWWNSPAGSEPGWGLYVAQQGDSIFAVSLGYDRGGSAKWFGMELEKTADNSYSGPIVRTTGPSYDAIFDPSLVTRAEVGFATLAFSDGDNGVFTSAIEGVDQPTKDITRYVFAEDDTACH